MHLSAIKLRGFKSFPDPVEVRLEPGVAVVVGPNGSGKSNVGDGIVWAAGSLSPRELRAEKPDDVLFAGGAGRKAADFCEVELVFDNADGEGPVEYTELSVARRLHRGGEGQYLLNRTAVRRTDLVELLADLGLGGGMHSIIGQGRVEEILASSPERRRELLEEAAGLGRFKRRRHRAELKLARVGVQVERARDLEDEVRKRLRPLALQATAAERAERLRGEVAGLRARVAELDLAACQVRVEEWEERRSAVTLARRRADERLGAVLAERGRAEEELADAAGGRESATASLYRLRSARERVGLRQEAATALGEDASAVLDEAAASAAAPDLGRLEAEAAEAAAERDRTAAQLGAARSRLDEVLLTERDARGEALQRYRGAAERVAVRHESAHGLHAALQAELEEVERLGGVDVAALERDTQAATVAARAAHLEHERLAAAAEAARGRLDALTRSLAEREGLPPAARALAEEGERLAIAGLRVDAGAERAVAAALGWRAAAVVADDPEHGLQLLERARRAGLGALAVVLRHRADEVVRRTAVVPADQLLDARSPAVTPEGHGYDPERGELWFAGETAEAVLLELESRRRALDAEVARLASAAERAQVASEQAAARAHAAEEAFAPYAHLAGRPRTSRAQLRRLVALAERLGAVLADPPDLGERLAAGVAEGSAALADAHAAVEAAARAAEQAAARAQAAETRLRAAAPARRVDQVRLRRVVAAAERLTVALGNAAAVCDRLESPLQARVDAGAIRTGELAAELRRLAGDEAELRRAAAEVAERASVLDVERARVDAEIEDARRRLEEAGADPSEGDDRDALAERAERLERKRIELGQVNPLAKEEYQREKERLAELTAQRADLEDSLAELEKLRAELTETVEQRFAETFDAVRTHFEDVATTLFPGGEGRLLLTEPEEEGGESGVEVELRPAGKRITRLSLLSGGEKALGAISFLFALFLARPCPFYLLDEVEAALDDTNIGRFVELLRRYADRAQFVVVTHQKRTMEAADVLYGVTMGSDGVSQVVSRRLPQEDRAALATA